MEKSHTSDDAEGSCQWWWKRTTPVMENDHTSIREGPHQCQRWTIQWWKRATRVMMQKDHTSHEEKPIRVDDEALAHALYTGEQWSSLNNLLCLLIASLHVEQKTLMLILGTVKNYGKRYGQPKLLAHEDRLIHFLQNPYFAFFISIEIMCLIIYCIVLIFHFIYPIIMLETKSRPSPYASKAIWQNAYIPLLYLLTVLQASTLSSVPETKSNFQFTRAHMHEHARACTHPIIFMKSCFPRSRQSGHPSLPNLHRQAPYVAVALRTVWVPLMNHWTM